MTVKAGRLPAGWMRLAAVAARSSSRVAKLCTGPPPVVAFVAALGSAARERWAGVTGLGRAALGPRRDAHVYAPAVKRQATRQSTSAAEVRRIWRAQRVTVTATSPGTERCAFGLADEQLIRIW
jgi:hypothetical protein